LSTGARARFGAAVVAAGLRAGDFFAGDLRAGVFPTACSAIFAFAARAGAFAFADVFFAALRASAGAAFTVLRTTVLRAAVFLTGLDDGVLGIAEMSVKKESIFYDAQKRGWPGQRRTHPVIARSVSDEAIQSAVAARSELDCFVEPVIGRRFAPTRWLAMTMRRSSAKE
jgi:hypothetical protein